MTSISSISSNNNIQSLSQVGQRNGMQPPPPPPDGEGHGKDGGGLLGAIDSALKSAGIEGGLESIFGQWGTNSTSSPTSTDGNETTDNNDGNTDAASALNSFLQNLISALQSQGTTETTNSEDSTDESSTLESSTTQGMPPPQPYGGHGMEAKLQSLISSLTSSDSTTSDTSLESNTSNLESSFQSLVSALGGNGGSTSLSGFLQALSTGMQHRGTAGNVVSTTA